MEDKSTLDPSYCEIINKNPNKKFILYIRSHPEDLNEKIFIEELVNIFGKCKELPKERLVIFIVTGSKVKEFIEKLNVSKTSMYLSFIQIEDELLNSNQS